MTVGLIIVTTRETSMADYRDLFDLIKIKDLLTQSFNNEELEEIAFFNFDIDISGIDTRSARVKKLIEHCLHRHTIEELLILVREQRPLAYKEKAPYQFSDYFSGYLQKWKSRGNEEYPTELTDMNWNSINDYVQSSRTEISPIELTDRNGNSITGYVERFLADTSANVLVIRGVPGAGKSTLLHTLMSRHSEMTIAELNKRALPTWIPVFIDLHEFSPTTQIENPLFTAIIGEILGTARNIPAVHMLRDRYRLLVFFDALDEVQIDNDVTGLKEVITYIDGLARQMQWSKFVIATRPADEVSHWLQRRNYHIIDISLLSRDKIQDHISKHWQVEDGDSLRSISDFVSVLDSDLQLPGLLNVPLQLDTLANFWKDINQKENASQEETQSENASQEEFEHLYSAEQVGGFESVEADVFDTDDVYAIPDVLAEHWPDTPSTDALETGMETNAGGSEVSSSTEETGMAELTEARNLDASIPDEGLLTKETELPQPIEAITKQNSGKLVKQVIDTLVHHDKEKYRGPEIIRRRQESLACLAAFLDGHRDYINDEDAESYFVQIHDYQWTKRIGIIIYFGEFVVGFHHQWTKIYFATLYISNLALAEEWEKIDQLFAQSQIKFWFDCINLFPDLFFTESRQKVEARMTTFMNKEKANG